MESTGISTNSCSSCLGGGFEYMSSSPLIGEDFHPIWLAHIFQMGWWKTTNQLPKYSLGFIKKKSHPGPSFRESCPSPTNREKRKLIDSKVPKKRFWGDGLVGQIEGIIFQHTQTLNAYLPTFGSFPWNMPLKHTLDLTLIPTHDAFWWQRKVFFFGWTLIFTSSTGGDEPASWGPERGGSSTWYLLVKL